MLIEQIAEELYVHSKKYRLSVAYVEKLRKGNLHRAKLKIILDSKSNNYNPIKLTAELQAKQTQLKAIYRKFASPRLYVHRNPRLTILEQFSIILRDTTSAFTSSEIQTDDVAINYRHKYWRIQGNIEATGGTTAEKVGILHRIDSAVLHISSINIRELQFEGKSLLELENQLKQIFILDQPDKEQKNKEIENMKFSISNQLKNFAESKGFFTNENHSEFHTNSSVFPIIQNTTLTINKQSKQQSYTQRQQLFRHIFLTELITHIIINQFGRNKIKYHKYKDGRINYWYKDEQLQALRSCGHRLSQFRDHSVETFQPSESEDEQSEISEEEKKDQEQKKVKTEVQRAAKKIKNVLKYRYSGKKNKKRTENFIYMSGEDKSEINKMRYCFHQMTRETDKTQALINFIQLVLSAHWPEDQLFSKQEESEAKKKTRMIHFLKNFKVKRQITSCIRQYTRESFFHKILNIGLRILKEPQQLTCLRLPFSHLFWSIKTLYQHQKKVIFYNKQNKNEKKVIKVYRGCQMSEKEIKKLIQNVGNFIEMQGFLSTTLSQVIASNFIENVHMIIKIPISNLKGAACMIMDSLVLAVSLITQLKGKFCSML